MPLDLNLLLLNQKMNQLRMKEIKALKYRLFKTFVLEHVLKKK